MHERMHEGMHEGCIRECTRGCIRGGIRGGRGTAASCAPVWRSSSSGSAIDGNGDCIMTYISSAVCVIAIVSHSCCIR